MLFIYDPRSCMSSVSADEACRIRDEVQETTSSSGRSFTQVRCEDWKSLLRQSEGNLSVSVVSFLVASKVQLRQRLEEARCEGLGQLKLPKQIWFRVRHTVGLSQTLRDDRTASDRNSSSSLAYCSILILYTYPHLDLIRHRHVCRKCRSGFNPKRILRRWRNGRKKSTASVIASLEFGHFFFSHGFDIGQPSGS